MIGLVAAGLLLAAGPGHAKYASLVMDADTGQVLHSVNADKRLPPASLTKMMTLFLVFEALDSGRLRLNQRLPVSAVAARQPPSKLGLAEGETIRVEDAILAMVTKSANDAATAVAEALGGTESDFAAMMTARARKLGMDQTTFRNASGLPYEGQASTAMDMALLARALQTQQARHYALFRTPAFTYEGATYANHNQLLKSYAGTDGIKTGYIRDSGFNLVASAKRGERRLIGVVFGGLSPGARNQHMASLLDRGFRQFQIAEAPTSSGLIAAQAAPATPASPRPTPSSAETWAVQVGVYRTVEPALDIARKAQQAAAQHLGDGEVKVFAMEKARSGARYRAQIVGLSKEQAQGACVQLKRRKIGCFHTKPSDGVEVEVGGS